MSSWLGRIAVSYGLSVKDLLTHNLDLPTVAVPLADLDDDPPAVMLTALAERTGVEPVDLRMMTLTGWRPWLFDTLDVRQWDNDQTLFDTYVRANSVLLAPGDAGAHQVSRFTSWSGPWLPTPQDRLHLMCPICVDDPDRGTSLMWRLPLMLSCGDHGCWLEDFRDVEVSLTRDARALAPRPVDEPLATLDHYTHDALTTGRVELPGRSVHAGVWFRLLRALLDEVSLAPSTLSKHGKTTLERVWQAAGRPERGGLGIWRPYEQLDWDTQQAMLHAAAVALMLAGDGQITARGRLACAIAPTPHQRVFDGDDPRQRPRAVQPYKQDQQLSSRDFAAALREWVDAIRVDPEHARQTLRMLTAYNSSPDNLVKQRHYLISEMGVPPEFLRLDLLPVVGRTTAETVALLEREGFDPSAVHEAVAGYPTRAPIRTDGQKDESDRRFDNYDLDQLRATLTTATSAAVSPVPVEPSHRPAALNARTSTRASHTTACKDRSRTIE